MLRKTTQRICSAISLHLNLLAIIMKKEQLLILLYFSVHGTTSKFEIDRQLNVGCLFFDEILELELIENISELSTYHFRITDKGSQLLR